MYLKNLSLVNFKNYAEAELQFSPRLNCFIGNNGSGKTNLLDAIHYLCFCKSYFNPIDSQNIRIDTDFFVIQGCFSRDEREETIFCGMKRGQKKQFKRNKKEYERFSDHIGFLPLVMVSPSDISLIIEGSDERRRFINSVISQYDKNYLTSLISYNRALEQRNILLKDFMRNRRFESDSLDIWDEQLSRHGNPIYHKRVGFIHELVPVFQYYYDYIATIPEEVGLRYSSPLHQSPMEQLLKENLDKDRSAEYTTAGIHKDDLELLLKNYPIKIIGSQGQQKTYLVSLKMAQFEFIRKINGFKPILLLDDLFDKLDAGRVKQIVNLVSDDTFGQIFITDTSETRLKKILADIPAESFIFRIDNGIVKFYHDS
jgi:DNA replication and repair protein RecF